MTPDRPSSQHPLHAVGLAVVGITDEGAITIVGAGAEELFGYSSDALIGRPLQVILPDLAPETLRAYLDVFKHSGGREIAGSGRTVLGKRSDGTTFAAFVSVDTSELNGVETHIAAISAFPSQASRYWLDDFFTLSLDLLAVASFEGKFLRLNPAWTTIFGHKLEDLMTRPFIDFVHPDDVSATVAVMEQLRSGRQISGFENRYRSADGTYRWLEWNAKAIVDRGIIISAAHDITRRHRFEEQLREMRDKADSANRSKSEFLSRMSHELRTPLNSVIGFAQLLQMDDLSEEQRENVETILRSGEHLLGLINEVLDIAKIEAGKLRLSLEPVHVREVLEFAQEIIGPQADERNILVTTDIPEHAYALADRQCLLQIVLNLLSNAIKYNREAGSVAIGVEVSGGTVTIGITDTGVGIDPSQFAKVFAPFERLGAESTPIEGTGVGLALSRALSQEMNGSLTMSSRAGEGSTFFLELPEAEPEGISSEYSFESSDWPADTPSGYAQVNVLYIEDNIANSKLMERALRTLVNVDLVVAVQGSIGLDLATHLRPDLILLDLHLPDLPGEQILRRIRSAPEIADTAVVICSADASPGQAARMMKAGADGYLTKPLNLRDLFKVIECVRAGDPIATIGETSIH